MTQRLPDEQFEKLRSFAVEAAQLLVDLHCEDIVLLDVRNLSQVCDIVLLASGTSDRQLKSVGESIKDLGGEREQRCFRSSTDSETTWIVIDFVDLVAHLFEPGQRAFYDMEGLWSDAPRIDWEREPENA